MQKFNVLPTDERFLSLTEEQKEFIWENYLLDNPDLKKKLQNRFHDSEFDEIWDNLEKAPSEDAQDGSVVSEEDNTEEDYSDVVSNYNEFLEENDSLSLPDYREVLAKKGIKLNEEEVEVDLSSVDIEDEDWEEVD